MHDRHRLWRIVANNREALNEVAPDGYEAVVQVTIAGREDAIVVGRVETSREPDFPWTLIYSLAKSDEGTPQPNDYMVFVPEAYVQTVEIVLRRKGESALGFSHSVVDEPGSIRPA